MPNHPECPLQWEHPSTAEFVLLQAMQRLFRSRPELMLFVFHPRRARLRVAPGILLKEIQGLSPEENLIVRIALTLWNQSGKVCLSEMIEGLDARTLEQVTQALRMLGPKPVPSGQPSSKTRPTTRASAGWDSQLF